MTTANILDRAADLIEQYGWVQGREGSEVDGFCAVGAIRATTRDEARYDAIAWLAELVRRRRFDYISLPAWNDDPSRTKDEVLSALRAAAKLAREEGR